MRLVTYRGTIESAARLGAIDSDMVVNVEKIGFDLRRASQTTRSK